MAQISDSGGREFMTFESNGHFSPGDGRFFYTFSADETYVWAVPPDVGDVPAPEWLLQLATICAGKRLSDSGALVDATNALEAIDDLRRTVAALAPDAPFAEWGRWIIADRATRSIAPGFTMTAAEAEKLAITLQGQEQ